MCGRCEGFNLNVSSLLANDYYNNNHDIIALFIRKIYIKWHSAFILKEYYEIVGESRPLSGFFPTHADFFTEMHI